MTLKLFNAVRASQPPSNDQMHKQDARALHLPRSFFNKISA
jgi:hypothetical protein